MKPRRADWILAAVIAAAALSIWVFAARGAGSAEFAQVRVDGKTVCTLDLRRDTEITRDGFTFQVRSGAVRVAEADCPDKVCVHTGWLSAPGQAAVCVPGRMTLTVLGTPEVDGVAG